MRVLENFIDAEAVAAYKKIADDNAAKFKHSDGFRRRIGKNGVNNLSEYFVWKRWDWDTTTRRALENNWALNIQQQVDYNEAWFLRFDQGGFFDQFAAGTDIGYVVSIPLNDGGIFTVNEQDYTNTAGSAYLLNLAEPHEVKPTSQQDLYLCFLCVTVENVI